jgi:hypothetical protein
VWVVWRWRRNGFYLPPRLKLAMAAMWLLLLASGVVSCVGIVI